MAKPFANVTPNSDTRIVYRIGTRVLYAWQAVSCAVHQTQYGKRPALSPGSRR